MFCCLIKASCWGVIPGLIIYYHLNETLYFISTNWHNNRPAFILQLNKTISFFYVYFHFGERARMANFWLHKHYINGQHKGQARHFHPNEQAILSPRGGCWWVCLYPRSQALPSPENNPHCKRIWEILVEAQSLPKPKQEQYPCLQGRQVRWMQNSAGFFLPERFRRPAELPRTMCFPILVPAA